MHVCAVRLALVGVGVGVLMAVPSARQSPQQPDEPPAVPAVGATPAPGLAGFWKLDPDESQDDERNWRRPVSPKPQPMMVPDRSSRGLAGGASGPVAIRRRAATLRSNNNVRRALRDLLEAAESYRIDVTPDHVTMTDDLGRTLTYATDGATEKHQLGATAFEAETRWYHAQLSQTLTSGALTLSQVFLPSEDGETLFLEIHVDKPDLKPPVKAITRVYTRIERR